MSVHMSFRTASATSLSLLALAACDASSTGGAGGAGGGDSASTADGHDAASTSSGNGGGNAGASGNGGGDEGDALGNVILWRFDLGAADPPNASAIFAAGFTHGRDERCTVEGTFGACQVETCTHPEAYEQPPSADAGTISVEGLAAPLAVDLAEGSYRHDFVDGIGPLASGQPLRVHVAGAEVPAFEAEVQPPPVLELVRVDPTEGPVQRGIDATFGWEPAVAGTRTTLSIKSSDATLQVKCAVDGATGVVTIPAEATARIPLDDRLSIQLTSSTSTETAAGPYAVTFSAEESVFRSVEVE